jgi:cell fate (sporulation/competence/biofilm development) regulator YmcA (YheA/YmcA/DUF963 family)
MKYYDSKEFVVRADIMAKTQELAALLTTSEEVQTYQKAEQQIQGHEGIQGLIAQIKRKQKEIVGFEYFKNADMVSKIEEEIAQLQDELDGYPVVQQFQQTQADINYLLQMVVDVLKTTLSEKIQVDDSVQAPPTQCD